MLQLTLVDMTCAFALMYMACAGPLTWPIALLTTAVAGPGLLKTGHAQMGPLLLVCSICNKELSGFTQQARQVYCLVAGNCWHRIQSQEPSCQLDKCITS